MRVRKKRNEKSGKRKSRKRRNTSSEVLLSVSCCEPVSWHGCSWRHLETSPVIFFWSAVIVIIELGSITFNSWQQLRKGPPGFLTVAVNIYVHSEMSWIFFDPNPCLGQGFGYNSPSRAI